MEFAPSLFRTMVESTRDLALVLDEEASVRYANPLACRRFGFEPGGPGSFLEPFPAADREVALPAMTAWRHRTDAEPLSLACRLRDHEGAEREIRWSLARIDIRHLDQEAARDGHDGSGSGARTGIVACGVDVTESARSAREVARRERHFRTVLDSVLDGVVTIDEFGTILDASLSVEGMLGWAPDDLRGRNVKVLMPEPYRGEHDGYLEHYRRTGQTWILNTIRIFEVLRRDGSRVTCELSVSRADIPGERSPVFCGVFRDVTERIAAQELVAESERRFRAVFDQEFQVVLLLDEEGRVVEPNESATEISGRSREDWIGTPVWEAEWWGSASDSARVREWVNAVRSGGFVRSEVVLVRTDGAPRTFDLSLKGVRSAIAHGHPHLILEARDITELKRAQRSETSMMRALAELGESAAILAHEIKNPITSVNLALRAVAKQLGTQESEVLEDLVKRMQDLEAKLRRTLSFARALDLDLSPCSTRSLCEQAAGVLAPEFEEHSVRLELILTEDVPDLVADESHLEQVLINLLRNALEAVEEDGRVRVEARRAEVDGRSFVEIRVEDDGPGIPESMRDSLFRPFTTSKSRGNGIGLALSRRIVGEHDGTIEVGHSSLGGASFVVRIPAADDLRPSA